MLLTFRGKNIKTRVIGCPKTIDGDLKSKEVPVSFGFDTACKVLLRLSFDVVIQPTLCCTMYPFCYVSAIFFTIVCVN